MDGTAIAAQRTPPAMVQTALCLLEPPPHNSGAGFWFRLIDLRFQHRILFRFETKHPWMPGPAILQATLRLSLPAPPSPLPFPFPAAPGWQAGALPAAWRGRLAVPRWAAPPTSSSRSAASSPSASPRDPPLPPCSTCSRRGCWQVSGGGELGPGVPCLARPAVGWGPLWDGARRVRS